MAIGLGQAMDTLGEEKTRQVIGPVDCLDTPDDIRELAWLWARAESPSHKDRGVQLRPFDRLPTNCRFSSQFLPVESPQMVVKLLGTNERISPCPPFVDGGWRDF